MRALLWTVGVAIATGAAGTARQQAAAERESRPWTQTRTPWGDPDLGGVWTSDDNFSVPLERPAEFAGKALLDGVT